MLTTRSTELQSAHLKHFKIWARNRSYKAEHIQHECVLQERKSVTVMRDCSIRSRHAREKVRLAYVVYAYLHLAHRHRSPMSVRLAVFHPVEESPQVRTCRAATRVLSGKCFYLVRERLEVSSLEHESGVSQ